MFFCNIKWLILVLSLFFSKHVVKSQDLNSLKYYEDTEMIKIKDTIHFLGKYDFIIIGAGSAGSVVANRLSEIPEWTVLLLEAGTDGDIYSDIPLFARHAQNTKYDWNYTTTATEHACLGFKDGVCAWPRGRVLGGSSVLNFLQYTRGNKEDFNTWRHLGNPGWGYDDVLRYFLKSEDMTLPELKSSKYHSTGGLLTVEGVGYSTILDQIFMDAGVETGYSVNDFNGKTQTGFYLSQATKRNGRRCSAAKAFLQPAQHRPNLHISKDSFVTKILIDPTTKVAKGVQFSKNGRDYTIYSRKEVILSAGAIGSPQMLMVSGVGPKKHLQDLGIHVIADLKVGYNLQDHMYIRSLNFKTPYTILPDDPLSQDNVDNFFENGQGVLTSSLGVSGLAFINSNQNINKNIPDIELVTIGSLIDKYSFSISTFLLHPKSKGRIALRSADINQHPDLQPNYLTRVEDLHVLREGMKLAIGISKSESFKRLNVTLNIPNVPACVHLEVESDEYWECLIRHDAESVSHQCGTCKMGPCTDDDAVVDPELLVHGIHKLRVVDASIMPTIPGAHTNAVVYMIAEKASDMVKQKWGKI